MKKNNLGFTLIELLAVVLIIGVLTAIALPQYRRSVQRAEAMEALISLKSVFESAKRYRAANSEAPKKLKGLDVSFFDASSDEDKSFLMGKFLYTFENDHMEACATKSPSDHSKEYCFKAYYNHSSLGRDALTCKTVNSAGKYGWLCEAIGNDIVPGTGEYNMSKKMKTSSSAD